MKKQANPGADYFSIKDTFMDPQLPIQNCFMKWVHDSTRGVEGYLMNFHGPTITYPKLFQEVGP